MSIQARFAALARRLEPARAVFRDAASIDLRSLALFRVALALVLIVNVLNRLPDAALFYGDDGVLPRSSLGPAPVHLRLFFVAGTASWAIALLLVLFVAAALLLVGWQTRLAQVVCWWLLACLHQRNGQVLQAGDYLLGLMLFWSLFVPLGARASLDAVLRHRAARLRGESPPLVATRVYGGGTVALYLQLAVVYFVTGTAKLHTAHWARGVGVYQALSADVFATRLGLQLYQHWWAMVVLTYATLLLEILGPFLLLVTRPHRLRTALVLSFIAFHAGLAATMRLGIFSWVCIAAWTFALPSGFWDEPFARLGTAHGGGQGSAPASSRPVGWIAGALAAYMIVGAVVSDRFHRTRFADMFLGPTDYAVIKLRWHMFVRAREETGWFVIAGRLADGREVDLLRGGASLSWDRPLVPSEAFPNQRWRKFIVNHSRKADERPELERMVRFLCRSWNQARPGGERLLTAQVVYLKRKLGERYEHGPTERDALVSATCER